MFTIFDAEKLGVLWAFPKGKGKVNIGYAGEFKDAKKAFNELMQKYGFSGLKREKELGGVLPVSGPIKKAYADRVLVAGTAAGFIHAGVGEGNYLALKSGIIAGSIASKAISQNDFSISTLKEYETHWKNTFWKRVEAGVALYDIENFGVKFGITERIFDYPSDESIIRFLTRDVWGVARVLWKMIRLFRLNRVNR
ncbi:hypothetical protein FJZ53_03835 [Candidatus Woesearchaeota archaeon]|nr:hypothetical protein [Candidatus Woesearchaeota archaeon]